MFFKGWIGRLHVWPSVLKALLERARRPVVSAEKLKEQRQILGQVIRFGIVGLLLTLCVAGCYWAVTDLFHVDPMVSMTLVYGVFTGIGYVSHSRVSFRGHGRRDRTHIRTVRFLVTNGLGFLSNQFFIWVLVKQLGGPTWWPILPIIFVTPALTFTLNRRWVFG